MGAAEKLEYVDEAKDKGKELVETEFLKRKKPGFRPASQGVYLCIIKVVWKDLDYK